MNLERMKRHLGGSVELKLGEDVFRISPLPLEYIGEFWSIVTKFGASEDKNNPLKSLDRSTLECLTRLIRISLEKCPDIDASDKEVLDAFIAANYIDLIVIVMEANMPTGTDSGRLDRLKSRYEHTRSVATAEAKQ